MLRMPTLVAVLAASLAAGCASTGYDRADSASGSVAAFDAALNDAHVAAEAAAANLNNVTGGSGDLLPVYGQYLESVGTLEAAVRKADAARVDMTAAADGYFARWGQEIALIQDPMIRTSSERRMEEVKGRFDGLMTGVDSLDAALKPCTTEMRDIQRALSVDLSAEGVMNLSESVKRANQRLAAIRERVKALRGDLDAVREGLAPTK